MSWGISIQKTITEWDWSGLTYNLSSMLKAGGIDLNKFDGEYPERIVDKLRSLRTQMIENPSRFKVHNPPNGWGDYEGCLRFVDEFTRELERAVREAEYEGTWRVRIT